MTRFTIYINGTPVLGVYSTRRTIQYDLSNILAYTYHQVYRDTDDLVHVRRWFTRFLSSMQAKIIEQTIHIFTEMHASFIKHCLYYVTTAPMMIDGIKVYSMIA